MAQTEPRRLTDITDLNTQMAGRPTDYTPELASSILGKMAEGDSIRTICKSDDMPHASTIYLWLQKHKEFSDKYEAAALDRAHMLAEEALEIADNGTNDWMERRSEAEKGAGVNNGYVLNGEHVQRSRLRVDTRKWFAARLHPKKYGDRLDNTHSGPDGGPIKTEVTEIKRTIVDPKS